ncbi:polyprenyl synthetase family protein [Gracilibacillus dipsosauri]|uniref:Geranyl transferase n=1 Tax=Gracilibacillus dipsosauri TaxID=178340 RepID=A0A317KW64_9BACI|nr:polyprenyl synthetase family protein [Gracilibacillus dipsosauri]PWU66940.1 geranyl transferase [Gracilibacillus dipsosauri]
MDIQHYKDSWIQPKVEKAKEYFNQLFEDVREQSFVNTLTTDLEAWKQSHIRPSLLRKSRKDTNYQPYLKWLKYTGKLDEYLDRSISYIYMRDLGYSLADHGIQAKINRATNFVKNYVIDTSNHEPFRLSTLYRWAQKEGIESTFFWLIQKLKLVSKQLPEAMDKENAQRKLLKIIAGVLLQELDQLDEQSSADLRRNRLDQAVRLGYSYGLTYPFIDDLLDANILSKKEEEQFSSWIRTTLAKEKVAELKNWEGENGDLVRFVYKELKEAFEYIRMIQANLDEHHFFELSYLFFHAQELDRDKDIDHPNYTNDELYLPIILKSACSRMIVRSLIGMKDNETNQQRMFFYGIYNQLADDLADINQDQKSGAVSSYTYYLKYYQQRSDLVNPFELYWTVIYHLIHRVYDSDQKTCEIILNRAINGLKRLKIRMGEKAYTELMKILTQRMPEFNRFIQHLVQKADNVDFFDKLLRDHFVQNLRNQKQAKTDFFQTIKDIRNQINQLLPIKEGNGARESISHAANYSIEGAGKRLRPIVTWLMGVQVYHFQPSSIIPLIRSLEYMHTASLIFDDLPSQDNASYRRGRETLHEKYNTAIAELTGLFLTQKAYEEQASLNSFDPSTVLQLIQYSAQKTAEMCRGQAIDLAAKGKELTIEELNDMCFYKTGIGFEASLVMPSILAKASEEERSSLKKIAYHAGIAFQIKDDLLDVEGDLQLLGKPVGNDQQNNSSTFVTILGMDGAKKEMWNHYCEAVETIDRLPYETNFLRQLLDFFVNREY